MSIFELKRVDPATGIADKILPHHQGIALSPVFSSPGIVEFSYPESGKNFDLLRPAIEEKDVEIAVFRDSVEIPDCRFIIEEYSGDEATEEEENALWSFTGRTMYAVLERAIIYPPGFGTGAVLDTRKFTNATAGGILGPLVTEAKARGAIPTIQIGSFSATEDSNGVPWTKQISIEYRAGVRLSEVLENLVDQGMVETRMYGRELRMYIPGSLSQDRTVGANPVILRAGRDLSDSPRKVSRKELASVFLAGGSEGKYAEAVNASGVATFGRWEAYDSQGGVSDPGTLTAYAQHQRDVHAEVSMEKSHGIVFGQGTPEPVKDFDLGDWIFSDTNGTKERLRVRQWVISQDREGAYTGSVVLGDLFSELQARLVKRMNGILGGTTLTGESRATDITDIIPDTIAPGIPQNPTFSSIPYMETDGRTRAAVTVTWDAVTTNADGSPTDDLDAYLVQYKIGSGGEWSPSFIAEPDQEAAYISGIDPDVMMFVRVAAVDRTGNKSPWSAEFSDMTAYDNTPPPQSSAPTAESNLGYIRVSWDGETATGADWPLDMVGVEIHQSLVNEFTPSSSTYVGYLNLRGSQTVKPLSGAGVDNFFKLIPYDRSYNKGPASNQAVSTSRNVVETDLGGNIIDYDNVKFKDTGNLVADGSFELDETQAEWDALNTARYEVIDDPTGTGPSKRVLRINQQPSGGQTVWLTQNINANDEQKHAAIVSWYSHGMLPTDSARLIITSKFPDGSSSFNTWMINITGDDAQDAWTLRDAAVASVRPGAYQVDIVIYSNITTPGAYVLFDEIEVRPIIPTLLIDDAAITRAKIANLAVGNAQIEDLQVGKLTSGTMSADMLLAGSIRTATSGERININGSGMFGYNDDEDQIFYVTTSGEAGIVGTIGARDTTTGNSVFMKPESNVYDPSNPEQSNPGIVFGFSSSWYVYPSVSAKDDGTLVMTGYMTASNSPQGFVTVNRTYSVLAATNPSTATDVRLVSGAISGTYAQMGRLRFFGRLDTGAFGPASTMFGTRLTGISYNRAIGYYYSWSYSYGSTLNSAPKIAATGQKGSANGFIVVGLGSVGTSSAAGWISNVINFGTDLVYTDGAVHVFGWQS